MDTPPVSPWSKRRVAAALLVGALGCLFVWVATPYNNFLLNNSYISDSFLPVAGMVFMLVLVLVYNPLCHWLRPGWVLRSRQLLVVFAMVLAAAVIPSQGLLRMLPWTLAKANVSINTSVTLDKAFRPTKVPRSIFPDPVGFDQPAPVSTQLLDELGPGETIPWGAWLAVLLRWSVFLLSCWLLMVGVGLVLFPHWREVERLPFPLLGVQQSLFEGVSERTVLPPIFRNRLFWVGAGLVLLLYACNGLNHHMHGQFPPFPMGWDLSAAFTEVPWRYMGSEVFNVKHIYFVVVGMAFFMPNRVGFSIWFTTLAYSVYRMIGMAYLPPFHQQAISDHRNGAMLAISLSVLFLSRHLWVRVAKALVWRARNDADRYHRVAGYMLVAGALGILGWLVWAGVPVHWAAVFVILGFLVSVLIARLVAETGVPCIRITGLNPIYFMSMLPAGWLTGAAIYMAGFVSLIFPLGSRVSAAVMALHAVGLDRSATFRQRIRIGYLMIAVLLVGVVVCGVVHLHMGYNAVSSLDGVKTPVVQWGSERMVAHERALEKWSRGAWTSPAYNQAGHLCFGIGLAGALQWASLAIPKWPLHPIGLILVGHYYSGVLWASVLLGWGLKMLIVRYTGAAGYRRAQALFIGLILGEIFAAVIWTLVPVILILLGRNPSDVGHIPLLPT